MKITTVRSWQERVELTRPYTIAFRSVSAVDLFFVEIASDSGKVGLGSASPAEEVTGESAAACAAALADEELSWLIGEDPRHLGRLCRILRRRLAAAPAARAAVDMALYDLFARALGVPLVDLLGRCHDKLPTSVTIGIKSTEQALTEADEYLARGFRCLKVKIGRSLDEDVERLHQLRERVGSGVQIRVDANQGYTLEETRQLFARTERLDLELIEQPLPAATLAELSALPESVRERVAADESLCRQKDALALAGTPAVCGIFNIKLMKCGGITSALAIAAIADSAGRELMWGCMDESAVSITAALQAAYASPATRYLDLDGSLDLARDPARGGFVLADGMLRLSEAPGLGVELAE